MKKYEVIPDEAGIEAHALLYALVSKTVLEKYGQTEGETILKEITETYGIRRGERMRKNAETAGYGSDLSAFFLSGEWEGKQGENVSALSAEAETTVSEVSVCAWYGTWRKYGLLPYGSYYCRWIDKAIAEGFAGSFSLSVPCTKGAGDPVCRFVWDEAYDPSYVNREKQARSSSYVRPFSRHCEELLSSAEDVLSSVDPACSNALLEEIMHGFVRLYKNGQSHAGVKGLCPLKLG